MLYNLTAQTINEKILIKGYTLPEPNPNDFLWYSLLMDNWKASKVSYPLKDECRMDFKVLVHKVYFESMPKGSYLDVETAFEKGISIDSIKERIEIKCEFCEYIYKEKNYAHEFACPTPKPYAILLPIQVEEKETQDNLWEEIGKLCAKCPEDSEGEIMFTKEVKSKYTIIRNK